MFYERKLTMNVDKYTPNFYLIKSYSQDFTSWHSILPLELYEEN